LGLVLLPKKKRGAGPKLSGKTPHSGPVEKKKKDSQKRFRERQKKPRGGEVAQQGEVIIEGGKQKPA